MSNGRTELRELDSLGHPDDNEHRLDAVIESLNSRITAFEQNLESAILSESHFRNNIRTLLNSVDAFVERHVEKDRHLTQLIEEDTQRSKDAKEEYDALASRFDDNLRRDSPRRTRDWLRTVSVYLGIVISVVLMAPLHALWWLLTKTLAQMGILNFSEESGIFSTARRRGRNLSHSVANSNRSSAPTRYHSLVPVNRGLVADDSKLRMLSSPSTQSDASFDARHTTGAPDLSGVSKVNGRAREQRSHPLADANVRVDEDDAHVTWLEETKSTFQLDEDGYEGESSESNDEFFDARNGSEDQPSLVKEEQPAREEKDVEEMSGDSRDHGNAPRRPGWAVPAGSDETPSDLGAFPSSDFWEISDDDIRLDAQRPSDPSS